MGAEKVRQVEDQRARKKKGASKQRVQGQVEDQRARKKKGVSKQRVEKWRLLPKELRAF